MILSKKKYCIIGTGGFGRETLSCLYDSISDASCKVEENVVFMVEDSYMHEATVMGVPVICRSEFVPDLYDVVVAIADPTVRKRIVNELPSETTFFSLIHPTAVISDWVSIGEGCIITAGVILTCDIQIGKHAQLNLYTTIGHDSEIGDFFTTAPSVNISGNCVVDDCVYIGTNSAVRDGVSINANVIIGMGAIVVKDIECEGTYIGNPARKI